MKHPLYFHWGVSTLFGWGVYGLNLLRHWQAVSGSPAYCIGQIQLQSLAGMDPLTLRQLSQPLVDSDQMRRTRDALPDPTLPLDGFVLHSLGNRFTSAALTKESGLRGLATAGVIFFEDTNLPDASTASAAFSVIVAGSTWCEQVLRANGVNNVATVIQGVDTSLFHPAPRAGSLEGRFAVFSGGKIERRKGQDLVLLAFRAFAQRHPEAILVTAWHSPWPIAAVTINQNPAIAPVGFTAEGALDMAGWVRANGIGENQYIDLGSIPNHQMARVLREMDVAVFPNRCEGGTNLVAMECMACGVPVILSDNTGHKDLTALGSAYALTKQAEVASSDGIGTVGWGESDVDEIVESLERVWSQREEARLAGLAGAEVIAHWNWRNQIARLHDVLAPLCP
ncbi:glycosyltransferase family 4 protein [Telmatospirillum sp.]|uniref:glycosyltransferase family 4 protein n=1 Tax=Telmatospirillum sp. TaxID=2079197 RepID=UPI00284D84F7|nr:glycosyltransferase family 4 protein [Telmatospirillum sp.]MDR3441042.1 glycosyltransferase family 4 protein [Telmatospirillum sp.]